MEDISSKGFKKKKNKSKVNKSLSIIETKKINSSSLKESKRGENIFNISSEFIKKNMRTYFSEKNDYKLEGLKAKFNFAIKSEPIICEKENILKGFSRKDSRYKEDNSPMINLKTNKKPNYLMKRYFIKDKSLTPHEKTFQSKSICPIYDFFNYNSGFNSSETDNLLQYSSFTKYHNYYKNSNKFAYSKPKENASSITHEKIYEMKKKANEKSNPVDYKEDIKLIDDYSYYNRQKVIQNIEENNSSKLNNLPYKTNDYRHMNVNININNNSQNNNIYYQLPNIINNYIGNSNNNYFHNNDNKASKINAYENNKNYQFYKNNGEYNENMNNFDFIMNQNPGYIIGEDNKKNFYKNYYLTNNLINCSLNNNNIISSALDYYRQNSNQTKINMNNQIQNQNSNYNQNIYLNQNQIDRRKNEINHLNNINNINARLSNYTNDYSVQRNNINNILLYNLQNNDNFKYNNFANCNINHNNINSNPMTNVFFNQNINNNNINNFDHLQMSLIENNNNRNSNIYNNQLLQSFNCNNQSQNNYPNYYPYFSPNNDNNIIKDYINTNLDQNDYIDETFLSSLTQVQLAQQCHIISKTQNGCRYLQNIILKNPELLRNIFFPRILEHIKELSNGQFSNYLIKKIFQFLSEDLILKLIQTLKPIIEQIGTNQYGTRVLQDLIDYLSSEKLFVSFINIILPYVKILIVDLNGSHIIYKLIVTKSKYVKIIENIICLQVKDIAITRKGCNFLKKYFDFANEKDLINIKKNILKNLNEIITDQYGNYVIQSIFTKEGSPLEEDFISEISKNIIFYSNNKFSSNAVEKCFENSKMKNIVLNQFLKPEIFENIIMDEFGNYVIQKAIAKADSRRKKIMFQLLKPLIPNLKNKYFGQRLLSRLLLQCPDLKINV